MASDASCDRISLDHIRRNARTHHSDIEAQRDNLTEDLQDARRDTFASQETSLSSTTLARQITWRVEDGALRGYPQLADLVGNSANYAIYRSFRALNARNLLYQQAKIAHLEHELNDLEKFYESHTHLHYSVDRLFRSVQDPGSPGHKLRSKHEEIASELGHFNHMLLEQARIHELAAPDPTFVGSLWDIINSATRGQWMQHPESAAYAIDEYRQPVQKDLVTLNRAFRQQDAFTRFFTGSVMSWWHWIYSKFKPPDQDGDFYVFGDAAVSRYMRAIVMIVAAALPTCSIVALYYIHSEEWRLVFIVLFSGLFAAALSFFTEAKSIEVFTASVALASVQVVFVGTAFGNGIQNSS